MKIKLRFQNIQCQDLEIQVEEYTKISNYPEQTEFVDQMEYNMDNLSFIDIICDQLNGMDFFLFKLMFKGSIIKDYTKTLTEYGVKDGSVMHLIKSDTHTDINIKNNIRYIHPKISTIGTNINSHLKINWRYVILTNSNILKNYFATKHGIIEASVNYLEFSRGKCNIIKIISISKQPKYYERPDIMADVNMIRIVIKNITNGEKSIIKPKIDIKLNIYIENMRLDLASKYEVFIWHPDFETSDIFKKTFGDALTLFETKNINDCKLAIEI